MHMGGGRSVTETIMGEGRHVSPFRWHIAKYGKQVGSKDRHCGGHRRGGRFNREFTRREGELGERGFIVEDHYRVYRGQVKF